MIPVTTYGINHHNTDGGIEAGVEETGNVNRYQSRRRAATIDCNRAQLSGWRIGAEHNIRYE